MSAIGFDPATVTGWAFIDKDGDWVTGTIDVKNASSVSYILRIAKQRGITCAYVEDCYFQANAKTLKLLQDKQTRIMVACEEYKLPVTIIMPSVWQGAWDLLGGKPARTEIKKRARVVAEQIAGRKLKTQDECDAVCIAEYGNSIERQGGLMARVKGGA